MNLVEVFVVAVIATVALAVLLRPDRGHVDHRDHPVIYWVSYTFWVLILGCVTAGLWWVLSWCILGLHSFFTFLGGLIFS